VWAVQPVAIVTGTGSGIGRATALRMAVDGLGRAEVSIVGRCHRARSGRGTRSRVDAVARFRIAGPYL
jgi:NAD(P)-dependent dehydrogenase (short-subunit alcohol dehydrogenase family)